VNALAIYHLRLGLINRGYYPVPMRDGVPAITARGSVLPTEDALRGWGGLYPDHTETGIWRGDVIVPVTEVPPTEAELHARTEAAAAAARLNKLAIGRAKAPTKVPPEAFKRCPRASPMAGGPHPRAIEAVAGGRY
jgi:hypothetical protein